MGKTPRPGSTTRLITVAALSMAAFGVVMTCLGASLQTVIARFGIAKAPAGALLSLLSCWSLAGSVVLASFVDRRAQRGMLNPPFRAVLSAPDLIALTSR